METVKIVCWNGKRGIAVDEYDQSVRFLASDVVLEDRDLIAEGLEVVIGEDGLIRIEG